MKKALTLIILAACLGSLAKAQTTYEIFFIERSAFWEQTSSTGYDVPPWIVDNLGGANYNFFAGLDYDGSTATPTNLTVENSGGTSYTLNIEIDEPTAEYEQSFTSAAALDSAISSGIYTFKENGSTIATIDMGTRNIPTPQLINNFDSLQNIDPTQNIIISWPAYTIANGATANLLEIEISYWDGQNDDVTLYDPATDGGLARTDSDLLPGIDPSATTFTIPANTLSANGPSNGYYMMYVFYADIFSLDETGGPAKVWLESIELQVPLIVSTPTPTTWAGYDIGQDGWVDTQGWMGQVNVNHAAQNWIYSAELTNWIYLDDSQDTQQGAWGYIPK